MNRNVMIPLLMLVGLGAFAQHEHINSPDQETNSETFKLKNAKLDEAYKHYLFIKDALVASKPADANKGAVKLQQALKDVNESSEAKATAVTLTKTTDLEVQRKVFSVLSNEMATLVKGNKISSGSIYLEYCPMANSNSGAYWLSNEKEIKNPYFGDKMLRCGSVKETIQ